MKTWAEICVTEGLESSDHVSIRYPLVNLVCINHDDISDEAKIGRNVVIDSSTIRNATIGDYAKTYRAVLNDGVVVGRRAVVHQCEVGPGVNIPKGMLVTIDLTVTPQIWEGESFVVYFSEDKMYLNRVWKTVERWKRMHFLKKEQGLIDFIHGPAQYVSNRVKDGWTGPLQNQKIYAPAMGINI